MGGSFIFAVLQSFVKWLLSAQVAALDEFAVKEGGVGRCFAGIGELIAQDVVLWQAGGGIPRKFAEDTIEITDGRKSAGIGDIGHCHVVSRLQEPHGIICAHVVEIL